jgi:viologen exporter family transport system ATP-binding protein
MCRTRSRKRPRCNRYNAAVPLIHVEQLAKSYRIADKQPGLIGTLRHFIRRRHRTIEAVKGITFDIAPGEIVGFLGPNGAGKTTALKMLTGLVKPTSGEVTVAGHTPFRRQAAFLNQITLVMGQKQQLIWDLPAMDSLRINAAVYEIPEADAKARIKELADMLGLDQELTQPVRKLSLGERMKAELLAALLHRPKVLFLDEPTLGLDVNAQAAVRQFLRGYIEQYGATVLLTSHYMADITALCPRVMLIHKGTLIYDGSLDGILARFAPYREVKVELAEASANGDFRKYGEIESVEGRVVRIIVKRSDLTHTVERMLDELDILDLTVADPPIEQVIGRVFREGVAVTAEESE